MSAAAIEARGLDKSFGDVHAVRDADFVIRSGRVTGFLGPNGAGKSTTLRMLLGLVHPDSGTALIAGRRYRDLASPARTIGAVLDVASAHPGMTARAHLRVGCALAGLSRTRVETVLDEVDATGFAERRIGTFSTGMRQRLSMATALLGDPEILVLDEPSNGLDPAGVAWLREYLRGFAGRGGTVLLSSHVLSEVQHTVDDVILIDQGSISWAGALPDLLADGASLESAFFHITRGVPA